MLDSPNLWPPQTGVYCIMENGQRTYNYNRFQLAPLYGLENDVIGGLTAEILGLSFAMMVEPPDMALSPSLKAARFRPSCIRIKIGKTTNQIDISWTDGLWHGPVEVTLLSKIAI
jgi:hypothetical protein